MARAAKEHIGRDARAFADRLAAESGVKETDIPYEGLYSEVPECAELDAVEGHQASEGPE